MKRVSFWALQHKITARFIIVLIYFFLNLLGLVLGDLLSSLNVVLSAPFYFIAILLTLGGVVIYPSKKRKQLYKKFYSRQKFADGLLIMATFLFITYSGNSFNYTQTINSSNAVLAVSIVEPPVSSSLVSDNSFIGEKSTKLSRKENRNLLRSFIKELRKKYKATSNFGKTLLISLVVLGALFLSFLMLGLACNIACSGSEALAYIVGVIGIGGIIFATVKLIQRISRGKPGKTKPDNVMPK